MLVEGNAWGSLIPPEDELWPADRTVTICVPAKNPRRLGILLEAINRQTYPMSLIEVVVADDGSEPPITSPGCFDFDLKIVEANSGLAFGAGAARNAAAADARGDVLIFLDADVLPCDDTVSAYTRWFSRSMDLLVMGFVEFVDDTTLTDDGILEALQLQKFATTFSEESSVSQDWRESTFSKTDDLRLERVDAFRVCTGASLAISSAAFKRIGGFRETGMRGIEDTEFGYRAHSDGLVLIPDRDARHWHLGARTLAGGERNELLEMRRPTLERLIPIHGFRKRHGCEVEIAESVSKNVRVPRFLIHNSPKSFFGSPTRNVAFTDGPPAFELPVSNVPLFPFCQVWTFGNFILDDSLLEGVYKRFTESPVGFIRVLSQFGGESIFIRTRALNRVCRHLRSDDYNGNRQLIEGLIAKYFGSLECELSTVV